MAPDREQSEGRSETLEELALALKAIRRTKTEGGALAALLEQGCRLLAATGASVYRLLERERLRSIAAIGRHEDVRFDLLRQRSDEALWQVVDTGNSLAIERPPPHHTQRYRLPLAGPGGASPLARQDGTVWGVLLVERRPSEATVSAAELNMLESLAQVAAETLQRITLTRETRHAERRVKHFADLSRRIELLEEPGDIATELLDTLISLTDFDYGVYYLREGEFFHPQLLTGTATAALYDLYRSRPLHRSEGILPELQKEGRTVVVRNYSSWTEGVPEYQEHGLRTVMTTPLTHQARLCGALELCSFRQVEAVDVEVKLVFEAAARRAERALNRQEQGKLLIDVQRQAYEEALRAIGIALEFRDYETKGHTHRVIDLARRFSAAVGLPDDGERHLTWGAYLHDIGKVAIPDDVLLKPARLSYSEMQVIKKHVVVGNVMLQGLDFLPEAVYHVVMYHHERWDGRGYPHELSGEKIPLLARMFALIDVYDALTSKRPYKDAWSHEDALAEIESQGGRHFDPKLTEVFMRLWN